ncbi:RNA polymerase sigma factor [Parasegetibacter sp. NRK P23]|uniref:RNA polymerase sigma factor n=1 Tax=Parasegetibacter sp. NRK P23 TaxID=2942999 RepID=UPI0020443624|nr:RNA polymerase sigma-70 factor [Parasegetibacter sp. NRK P23]MCM5527729.1 RNA polymerase sigma-70 factor [Parasegetibacter sp. NRK P23]
MQPNTNLPSDEAALLLQLKRGDENALDVIYRKYWEGLFFYSYHLLKDKHACEDVIQDLFVRLWENREQLDVRLSLKAYLYASCRYALYKLIRKEQVREDIFDAIYERLHTETAYGNLEHKELVQQINVIVNGLPPKCREVYELSRKENLSYKEIGERLGISVKTVENHINRALKELKQSLGGLVSTGLLVWLLGK